MNGDGSFKADALLVANTALDQPVPAISIDGDDNYLVTYTTLNGSDTSGFGVNGQFGHLP